MHVNSTSPVNSNFPPSQTQGKRLNSDQKIIELLKLEIVKANEERDAWGLKYDDLKIAAAKEKKTQSILYQQLAQGIKDKKIDVPNEFVDLFYKALSLNTEVLDALEIDENKKTLKSSKAGFTVLNEVVAFENPKETIKKDVEILEQGLELLKKTSSQIENMKESQDNFSGAIKSAQGLSNALIENWNKINECVVKLRTFINQQEKNFPRLSDVEPIAFYNLSLDRELMNQVPESKNLGLEEKIPVLKKEVEEQISLHQNYINELKGIHDKYLTLLVNVETVKQEINWKKIYYGHLRGLSLQVYQMNSNISGLEAQRHHLAEIFNKSKPLTEAESKKAKQESEGLRLVFQGIKKGVDNLNPLILKQIEDFNRLLMDYDETKYAKNVFKNAVFFDESIEFNLREIVRCNAALFREKILDEVKSLTTSSNDFQLQILGMGDQKGILHYELNYLVSSVFQGSLKVKKYYAQGEPGGWKFGVKTTNRDYMMSEVPLETAGSAEMLQ